MYALVKEGMVDKVQGHPGWRNDEGELIDDATLATFDYYKLIEEPIEIEPRSQTLRRNDKQDWLIDELAKTVTVTYTVDEIPTEDIRNNLIEQVTALRKQKEASGLTLPTGVKIKTDIDDQNRITSVINNAPLAGITEVNFKAESGWVSLTIDDLKTIAGIIGVYVQDCFNAEMAHHVALATRTRQELIDYDVEAGWPENDLST